MRVCFSLCGDGLQEEFDLFDEECIFDVGVMCEKEESIEC